MQVTPIKTRTLCPPKDDFVAVLDAIDLNLVDGSVVAVSAKAVAIHQGRSVPMPDEEDAASALKEKLAKEESEFFLERDLSVPFPRIFTVYEGTFCSTSGIDASNGNGYFVLLPKESGVFAANLRRKLQEKYGISNVGVLVVDSRSYPMRNGTIGMTLGYAGFRAMFDYRDKHDIFGRAFNAERINVADCLASSATLAMGEGAESTPVAVIADIPHITFCDDDDMHSDLYLNLKVPMEYDVFTQFYKNHNWKRGGGYTT